MEKILLIEDDKRLSDSLIKLFHLEGLATDPIESLADLDYLLNSQLKYETIVLDRILHGVDSKNYIHKIKARWPQTAILILSAINTPIERTELINLGADDYLGKPFSSSELLARLKSLQRRYSFASNQYITIGNTTIDLIRRSLSVNGKSETLPAKEFLVLKMLTNTIGKIFNKMDLLESIWGINLQTETNVVEATMANLRKKISQIDSDIKIKNSRNSGYWIEA